MPSGTPLSGATVTVALPWWSPSPSSWLKVAEPHFCATSCTRATASTGAAGTARTSMLCTPSLRAHWAAAPCGLSNWVMTWSIADAHPGGTTPAVPWSQSDQESRSGTVKVCALAAEPNASAGSRPAVRSDPLDDDGAEGADDAVEVAVEVAAAGASSGWVAAAVTVRVG